MPRRKTTICDLDRLVMCDCIATAISDHLTLRDAASLVRATRSTWSARTALFSRVKDCPKSRGPRVPVCIANRMMYPLIDNVIVTKSYDSYTGYSPLFSPSYTYLVGGNQLLLGDRDPQLQRKAQQRPRQIIPKKVNRHSGFCGR